MLGTTYRTPLYTSHDVGMSYLVFTEYPYEFSGQNEPEKVSNPKSERSLLWPVTIM